MAPAVLDTHTYVPTAATRTPHYAGGQWMLFDHGYCGNEGFFTYVRPGLGSGRSTGGGGSMRADVCEDALGSR
jgi:hypothetical protein